jgi:hypothetical protein
VKLAIFGGDLFWSNLPYEALNYYYKVKKNNSNTKLIMFENDIRLNKVFSGNEKFFFKKDHYTGCKDLITIKNWDEFYNISNDFDLIYTSCKIAPKTRYPHNIKNNLKKNNICAWDTGGVDILVDSQFFANKWIVKGKIWKEYLINAPRSERKIKPEDVKVGSCPLYDRYVNKKLKINPIMSKNNFFKKYSISENEKVLLVTPSNPGSHQAMFNENLNLLSKVLSVFKNNNFSIVLKTYPHDYMFYENESRYSGVYKRKNFLNKLKTQYDYLMSLDVFKNNDVKLIESQDHHEAILYSDTMYNMSGSSISWETFYSDCKSFSIGYEKASFFKTLSYLPGCHFPDEYFNLNFENNTNLEYTLEKIINEEFVNFKTSQKLVGEFFT